MDEKSILDLFYGIYEIALAFLPVLVVYALFIVGREIFRLVGSKAREYILLAEKAAQEIQQDVGKVEGYVDGIKKEVGSIENKLTAYSKDVQQVGNYIADITQFKTTTFHFSARIEPVLDPGYLHFKTEKVVGIHVPTGLDFKAPSLSLRDFNFTVSDSFVPEIPGLHQVINAFSHLGKTIDNTIGSYTQEFTKDIIKVENAANEVFSTLGGVGNKADTLISEFVATLKEIEAKVSEYLKKSKPWLQIGGIVITILYLVWAFEKLNKGVSLIISAL